MAEAIAWGEIQASQRFDGLKNTQELKDTVSEMFNGTTSTVHVDHVQGATDRFKCTIFSEARDDKEISNLVETFEKNTYTTTKISKYK